MSEELKLGDVVHVRGIIRSITHSYEELDSCLIELQGGTTIKSSLVYAHKVAEENEDGL